MDRGEQSRRRALQDLRLWPGLRRLVSRIRLVCLPQSGLPTPWLDTRLCLKIFDRDQQVYRIIKTVFTRPDGAPVSSSSTSVVSVTRITNPFSFAVPLRVLGVSFQRYEIAINLRILMHASADSAPQHI